MKVIYMNLNNLRIQYFNFRLNEFYVSMFEFVNGIVYLGREWDFWGVFFM